MPGGREKKACGPKHLCQDRHPRRRLRRPLYRGIREQDRHPGGPTPPGCRPTTASHPGRATCQRPPPRSHPPARHALTPAPPAHSAATHTTARTATHHARHTHPIHRRHHHHLAASTTPNRAHPANNAPSTGRAHHGRHHHQSRTPTPLPPPNAPHQTARPIDRSRPPADAPTKSCNRRRPPRCIRPPAPAPPGIRTQRPPRCPCDASSCTPHPAPGAIDRFRPPRCQRNSGTPTQGAKPHRPVTPTRGPGPGRRAPPGVRATSTGYAPPGSRPGHRQNTPVSAHPCHRTHGHPHPPAHPEREEDQGHPGSASVHPEQPPPSCRATRCTAPRPRAQPGAGSPPTGVGTTSGQRPGRQDDPAETEPSTGYAPQGFTARSPGPPGLPAQVCCSVFPRRPAGACRLPGRVEGPAASRGVPPEEVPARGSGRACTGR